MRNIILVLVAIVFLNANDNKQSDIKISDDMFLGKKFVLVSSFYSIEDTKKSEDYTEYKIKVYNSNAFDDILNIKVRNSTMDLYYAQKILSIKDDDECKQDSKNIKEQLLDKYLLEDDGKSKNNYFSSIGISIAPSSSLSLSLGKIFNSDTKEAILLKHAKKNQIIEILCSENKLILIYKDIDIQNEIMKNKKNKKLFGL